MNTRMKHTLVEGLVVGTLKGVAAALIMQPSEEKLRKRNAYLDAVALQQTFDIDTTDEEWAEYFKLMEQSK
ncbi:hypothetical protein PBI_SPORTO_34 [Arthrobacter phage Sporto]|nr:hypothetical protein PBI_SPORTO_34 [Arthrobacter phage Sporto]